MNQRSAGVLLPVTALPGPHGIGCFSKEAYAFVDFLSGAGQTYWQILPLGPTGYGDSPYQSFSTFAGNPYLIDPEELAAKGWLTKEELLSADEGLEEGDVDYGRLYRTRWDLLRKAFRKSPVGRGEEDPDFRFFCMENAGWLPDYCLFMAIKDEAGGASFLEWEEELRLRDERAVARKREELAEEIRFYEFLQYVFYDQWRRLKAYAGERGIRIIGDIPIYVALDSADTWSHPEYFQLDERGIPTSVAGCPPDGFSATGQVWGNPLYDWEYHEKTGFAWWMERLRHCFSLYDVVRIDHFRGFDEYFAIPYGDETAAGGEWRQGPGIALFRELENTLGKREIIAEDLGYLKDSVIELVRATGFPGMKVLEFGFDSREASSPSYLPHNYTPNSVVYTGTHDNATCRGWYRAITEEDRTFAEAYVGMGSEEECAPAMVRMALGSVSNTAVIPLQDYLNLGDEARINTPSTLGKNWKWRLSEGMLTEELQCEIRHLTETFRRGRA